MEPHRAVVTRHDVIVLGGGPAGAVAAAGLARRGHDVLLIARRRGAHRSLAESLPPSTRKLLAATGLLDAVQQAGFLPNGGNTVWWAGGDERSESFANDSGFQVDAQRLEDVALGVARAAGVRVAEGGARAAQYDGADWTVVHGAGRARAGWVIDATGRAGLVARQGLRAKEPGPRTLALIGRWRSPDAGDPAEATHTLVESYRDGWAWSVPLSASVRCVTAMVDPEATALDRSTDLRATYLAELRKTTRLAARLVRCVPEGPVWACPATPYTAHAFARPGLLLAGDAGSFIDPLSSFGVKKALASGWLAAIAIHSSLRDAPITQPAVDLFDAREREMYDRYASLAGGYFAVAAAHHLHSFWTRRSGGLTDVVPDGRNALDDLRARARLDLEPGPTLRTVRGPVIRGDRIVLADLVATDAEPAGVGHVRGVDLPRLIALAPAHHDVPALYDALAPRPPLPDFLAALAFALGRGFLRHRS